MKRLLMIAAFCILSAVGLAIAADATKDSAESRPAWCKPGWKCQPENECSPAKGWRCISTKELGEDGDYHYDLQEQVLRYKRRAQRFGLTVGPGIGAASVIDSNFDAHWVGTTGVFLVWGIRFP